MRVPTFGRFVRAHPHPRAPRVAARDLAKALTRRCTTDLHFTAYAPVEGAPFRLSKASKLRVMMQLAVFDVDHKGDEAGDLRAFTRAHPNAFLYETKNGFRIVLALPEPMVISSPADETAWTAVYKSWLRYLVRRFGIRADSACADWTRIYRLPHACRDGVVQELDVLGDPNNIGTWQPNLSASDRVTAEKPEREYEDEIDDGVDHVSTVPLGTRVLKAIDFAKNATPAVSGEGGHNTLLAVVADIRRGFDLPPAFAHRVLRTHYNPRCEPPWSSRELAHKLDAVEARGEPWGHLLEPALEELFPPPPPEAPPKAKSGGNLADRLRNLKGRGERQPLGFDSLDGDVMRGGIPQESITFIGGAPGAGKTGFVVHQAFAFAKRGCPVAILASDERADGLAIRVGQLLGFKRDDLENGNNGEAAAAALGDIPISLFDAREGYTIESAAKALHEAHGPGLLVIDSMQTATIKGSEKEGTVEETDRMRKIVKVIARMAAKYGHAMMVTSELNREFYRNNVRAEELNDLAAFKGSGAIEYAADFAIVLRTQEGGEQILAKVAKNRLGYGKPEFFLEWDAERATMTEVAKRVADDVDIDDATPRDGEGVDLERVVWGIVRDSHTITSKSMLSFAVVRNGTRAPKAKIREAVEALLLDGRIVKGAEGALVANPWGPEPDE